MAVDEENGKIVHPITRRFMNKDPGLKFSKTSLEKMDNENIIVYVRKVNLQKAVNFWLN